MKNLILILMLLFSTTAFSRTVVNTYECGYTIVKLYDDNTCDVGGLTYEIVYQHSMYDINQVLYFTINGSAFLFGYYDEHGHLVIHNVDDIEDKRYFVKCY